MPVKFENKTIYRREFSKDRGQDQQKSSNPEAGIPSTQLGLTREPALQHKKHPKSSDDVVPLQSYTALEPPLQRKKKPIQPHGLSQSKEAAVPQQNGTEVWKSGDEYVLLGNQDKFTANIKYKAKPIPVRQSVEEKKTVETPVAPRPAPQPAPRVSVDTGAPRKNTKKSNTVSNVKDIDPKPSQPPPEPEQRESILKPVKSVGEPRGRSREKQRPVNKKQPSTDVGHVTIPATNQQQQKPGNLQPQQQQQVPATTADSDYALKYKAGIAPPRAKGPKRLSEYQMQYAWKKGVGASPILDAENVVYKSSTQLVPVKAEFAKTSEYRKQYQPWEIAPQPQVSTTSEVKKGAARRSKSVEASKRDPAGVDRVTSDHDPRLVQESLNPLRLHFPHGPQKKEHSEYALNYLPPSAFSYDQGVWKNGAKIQEPITQPEETSPASSWFAEVQELRHKAEEYKKRAQGTHFSRQHVAQLLAQQNNLWDTASTSSVLSALSLEHGQARTAPVVNTVDLPVAGRPTAWGHDRDPIPDDTQSVVSGSSRAQSHRSAVSEASTIIAQVEADLASQDGRVPTPKMSDSKRHHLDRTTPLTGGALLTSPNGAEAKKSKGKKKVKAMTSPSLSLTDATPPATPVLQPAGGIANTQTSKSVDALIRPTYGKPTPDTHALLDEDASTDRSLHTNFVAGHSKNKQARHNRDKFPAASVPSTIQEDGANTYKAGLDRPEVTLDDIPPRGPLDDDVLSMSMRSVASSCSLASEVLERARQRKDAFWGQTNGLSGRV